MFANYSPLLNGRVRSFSLTIMSVNLSRGKEIGVVKFENKKELKKVMGQSDHLVFYY